MMLSVLFLSCLIAGSLACSDDHCLDPSLPNLLMSVKYLPNQEQLRTICPKVITFLECEKGFLECPGRSLDELTSSSDKREASKAKGMMGALNLVRDLCDEESSFHHDYLGSVYCIRGVFEEVTRTCREEILKPIEDFLVEISEDGLAKRSCLREAFDLACIVENLGESCGNVARRTAVTALDRMKDLLKAEICADVEDAADLKSRFLDFLQLDEQRRSNLQEIFDLVKRRR